MARKIISAKGESVKKAIRMLESLPASKRAMFQKRIKSAILYDKVLDRLREMVKDPKIKAKVFDEDGGAIFKVDKGRVRLYPDEEFAWMGLDRYGFVPRTHSFALYNKIKNIMFNQDGSRRDISDKEAYYQIVENAETSEEENLTWGQFKGMVRTLRDNLHEAWQNVAIRMGSEDTNEARRLMVQNLEIDFPGKVMSEEEEKLKEEAMEEYKDVLKELYHINLEE